MPKLLVACVMVCCDTYVKHERFAIPIIDSNFGKLFRFPISAPNGFHITSPTLKSFN